jgi:ubiquinone/menaquinone biosynthesis C-methylase UbiE
MIYDKLAKGYDRAFAPMEKRFLSKWREETLSYLPENSRILEIGAGTGLNFRFYPQCQTAVASEISFKMLEFAKEKNEFINLYHSLKIPLMRLLPHSFFVQFRTPKTLLPNFAA